MDQARSGLLSPWLRARRLAAVRPFVSGSVLDVGCGIGLLAAGLSPEQYCGVDLDPDSLAEARRLFPRHRFLQHLPDSRVESFDTVLALAVIEHIRQPSEWVNRLEALLKPGGRVVLTTPHPSTAWVHALGARLGLFSREAAEEHQTLLDADAAAGLARAAGLTLAVSRGFLFGANQLFVMEKR